MALVSSLVPAPIPVSGSGPHLLVVVMMMMAYVANYNAPVSFEPASPRSRPRSRVFLHEGDVYLSMLRESGMLRARLCRGLGSWMLVLLFPLHYLLFN